MYYGSKVCQETLVNKHNDNGTLGTQGWSAWISIRLSLKYMLNQLDILISGTDQVYMSKILR